MHMPEIRRLTVPSDRFGLRVVKCEATPKPLMKLSIPLHTAGLSLTYTVSIL